MSGIPPQAVFWEDNWTVASGCVERIFTLQPREEGQIIARFRAQVQGFIGGIDDLYLGLLEVSRAIESDIHRMLEDVVKIGRTIFNISVKNAGDWDPIVICVERDPRDLMAEVGGWPKVFFDKTLEEIGTDLDDALKNQETACLPKDAIATEDIYGVPHGRVSAEPGEVDLTPGKAEQKRKEEVYDDPDWDGTPP